MMAKLLIGWGATILALLYLAVSVSAAADAYVRGGGGGLLVAIMLASAIPALLAGLILSERVAQR